jgi:hypothetical protein
MQEIIEKYESLLLIQEQSDNLEIEKLKVLESLYKQALILSVEQHPYTYALDAEVRQNIAKSLLCKIS